MTKIRRKSKPFDPAQKAREEAANRGNPASWGANLQSLSLPQQRNVHTEAETRTKTARIRRYDCWALLHTREVITPGQLACIRTLQGDVALAHGVAGPSEGTGPSTPEQGIRASQIDASRRVEAIYVQLGDYSLKIVKGLIEPEVIMGRMQNNWRLIVQSVIGEHRHIAQTAALKRAADQVEAAYAVVNGGLKVAA